MQQKTLNFFIWSFGVLLFITGLAKLISDTGSAGILNKQDPIFLISFRYLLYAIGVAELIVAAICFTSKNQTVRAGVVALLATNFVLYRFGLYWEGYTGECKCLGNLTDALHIPPQIADMTMKIILAYLLIGSYTILFWLWRQKNKKPSPVSASA